MENDFISSVISIGGIFFLIYNRFPTIKEFLFHLLIIFIVFSLMIENYSCRTVSEVVKYVKQNIKNIKKLC